jgi:hypothetical protein
MKDVDEILEDYHIAKNGNDVYIYNDHFEYLLFDGYFGGMQCKFNQDTKEYKELDERLTALAYNALNINYIKTFKDKFIELFNYCRTGETKHPEIQAEIEEAIADLLEEHPGTVSIEDLKRDGIYKTMIKISEEQFFDQ